MTTKLFEVSLALILVAVLVLLLATCMSAQNMRAYSNSLGYLELPNEYGSYVDAGYKCERLAQVYVADNSPRASENFRHMKMYRDFHSLSAKIWLGDEFCENLATKPSVSQ